MSGTDSSILTDLRQQKPRIHCITNYVTAGFCADLLHACGALPIMADAPEEAAAVTAHAAALTVNLGTLSPARLEAMLASGRAANRRGIPVVLDPVGAGASAFRQQAADLLLKEIRFSAIRGNASEIRYLAGAHAVCSGADVSEEDALSDATRAQSYEIAAMFARKTGAVILMTGGQDLLTDGNSAYFITNGHPMMSRITGSGCMLSAMTAAYLAVRPEHLLQASLTVLCAMGLSGELAAARMLPQDGNASFRCYLTDAVYNLTEQQLKEGARYEVFC